ncbi:MAG: UDP-N-acetylmuramate--L-alanine ligase [Chlamydiota bacterium]
MLIDSSIYYFIGIGGIGMSALAKILLERGHIVFGSDLQHNRSVQDLRALGATIYSAHLANHIQTGMQVVYSSAIQEDNPEWIQAKKLGLTILHRSELLDRLMQGKKSLLITGAHGKTSVTGMVATLLKNGGLSPSFVIGGYLRELGTNAEHGNGQYFIAEADESDGSFLCTPAFGAIVTNTDEDHLDYWLTKERLQEGYLTFIQHVKCSDLLFLCEEDFFLKKLQVKANYYGFSDKADLRITGVRNHGLNTEFDLEFEGKKISGLKMPIHGRHQVLNMAAAVGMAIKLGVSIEAIEQQLLSYTGVKRRLEFLGEEKQVQVFDDYAHHPVEVVATLTALKQSIGNRRLVVVFQPHRYTRLQHHMEAFAESLKMADLCIVTDVYSAGEKPIEQVSAESLLTSMQHHNAFEVSTKNLIELLVGVIRSGDVLVTLGAGDITRYGPLLLDALKSKQL